MRIKTIKKDGCRESRWSGGRTWEIAIFPETASYLDRDFLWRLSTASSDLEESSFTKLPDYDRILMVLEGDVILAHGDVRTAHLQRLEQDSFDGAEKTRCYGKLIRDYNLIYRKGCLGRMELQRLKSAAAAIEMRAEAANSVCSYGIFCLDGYAVVSCGDESQMLREGDQAVIDFPRGAEEDIRLMGEGSCIVTEVIMAVPEGAEGSAEGNAAGNVPETAAGGSDYLTSLRLFASRNRWAMILRREGKSNVYYDRAMAEALRRLEKWYITEIIWLVGVLLCFAPLAAGVSPGRCLLLAVLFTILHLLGIIPFVYLRMLPRPFAAHMKRVSDLNAAERAFHEEEIRQDPHFERLMSKYRTDEDGYFNDESSPLYRLARRRDK